MHISYIVGTGLSESHTEVDLGFSERGAIPSDESLKQEVWGHSPTEAIGCLVFELSSIQGKV